MGHRGHSHLLQKSASVDRESAKYLSKLVNKFGRAINKSQGGVKISQLGREDEKKNTAENVESQPVTNTKQENMLVEYDFGVTQEDIDMYVEKAYNNENTEDYKKYAKPSKRLLSDISQEIDISEYSHALRDNDIRHIRNSHGEQTNEKYPITSEDLAKIPHIVANYDKVFVKTNSKGKPGIVYVKVGENDVIYYVEAVTQEYHKEKLLVNKQMIKTGINEIPKLFGLIEAINKKESNSQYLADLQKIRKAYVQDVKENYSNNSISENGEKINTFDKK